MKNNVYALKITTKPRMVTSAKGKRYELIAKDYLGRKWIFNCTVLDSDFNGKIISKAGQKRITKELSDRFKAKEKELNNKLKKRIEQIEKANKEVTEEMQNK